MAELKTKPTDTRIKKYLLFSQVFAKIMAS